MNKQEYFLARKIPSNRMLKRLQPEANIRNNLIDPIVNYKYEIQRILNNQPNDLRKLQQMQRNSKELEFCKEEIKTYEMRFQELQKIMIAQEEKYLSHKYKLEAEIQVLKRQLQDEIQHNKDITQSFQAKLNQLHSQKGELIGQLQAKNNQLNHFKQRNKQIKSQFCNIELKYHSHRDQLQNLYRDYKQQRQTKQQLKLAYEKVRIENSKLQADLIEQVKKTESNLQSSQLLLKLTQMENICLSKDDKLNEFIQKYSNLDTQTNMYRQDLKRVIAQNEQMKIQIDGFIENQLFMNDQIMQLNQKSIQQKKQLEDALRKAQTQRQDSALQIQQYKKANDCLIKKQSQINKVNEFLNSQTLNLNTQLIHKTDEIMKLSDHIKDIQLNHREVLCQKIETIQTLKADIEKLQRYSFENELEYKNKIEEAINAVKQFQQRHILSQKLKEASDLKFEQQRVNYTRIIQDMSLEFNQIRTQLELQQQKHEEQKENLFTVQKEYVKNLQIQYDSIWKSKQKAYSDEILRIKRQDNCYKQRYLQLRQKFDTMKELFNTQKEQVQFQVNQHFNSNVFQVKVLNDVNDLEAPDKNQINRANENNDKIEVNNEVKQMSGQSEKQDLNLKKTKGQKRKDRKIKK